MTGLDGLRGLAALFVVLHHCYLMSYEGFPANTGPAWLGWLLYGHLAVVLFIALSGFSLALAPARHDWQLGGKARFAHRRAWRILPPYWAALVFSLIIAWAVVPQPGSAPPDGKSVVVYGLLLQDVFGSPVPNGAFWSIAVEAQLYVVFPLLLLLLRRAGAVVMVGAVTTVVVLVGLLAPHVAAVQLLMRFTPQMAVLFALGLAAAGVLNARERIRELPWQWLALAAALPVLLLVVVRGSVWWSREQFWADLAFAPAIALLLAAVATGKGAAIERVLGSRPIRRLGSFSYSLYLIHAPIVVAISTELVAPAVGPGLGRFAATLALAAPVSVGAAFCFAAVFEAPFQRHRSWSALREAASARRGRPPAGLPDPAKSSDAAQPTLAQAAQGQPTLAQPAQAQAQATQAQPAQASAQPAQAPISET